MTHTNDQALDNGHPWASLDTPNARPALERFLITLLAALMQGAFNLVTVGVDLRLPGRKDRISATVQTGATGPCRVLVYLPKPSAPNVNKATGVVMHLHGSGWTVGSPQSEHRAAKRMAEALGTVVVCPNYKKAPRHPYPFALYQMHGVLDWIATGGLSSVLKKRTDIALDTTRIAVSGGSAGGNLAASVALLTHVKPLSHNARVVALGLLYPHVDAATPFAHKLAAMENADEVALPPWVSRFFLKAYLPPPRDFADPYVSPLRAPLDRLAVLPETVVVTASKDYLAREGNAFADKLEEAGVRVHSVRCMGVGHAFDLEPALGKAQRMRNRKAVEDAWGTVVDVFRTTLS